MINKLIKLKKWIVVYYVVVEIKEDGSEEKFIEFFYNGGFDLEYIIVDGYIVLGIVCEYRNKRLIDYLIKCYLCFFDIEWMKLKEVVEVINDEEVILKINNVIVEEN